ncbi:toll/interleukin-1 receptor domain-containing protein [Streptomyces sp. NPDC056463]|uniref:toll/interleukin-1 receptor domain-containing protein n=1 Tax=Streptomyces sp. NPDC056463 TaxID=3345827 RepID=UPI0036CC7453
MRVFLSWSGERSKKMAETLKTWLPDVLQAVQPWISSQDISKGSRGLREIADELAEVNFGIICVTAENQASQWVNFEAGALSKQMGESLVVPLLLDIKTTELTGPLAQFQATESASKEDVKQLMGDVNTALGDSGITDDRLARAFDRAWPDLEEKLESIRGEGGSSNPARSTTDMLEELLVLMRQQDRRIARLDDEVRITFQERDTDRSTKISAEDRVIRVEASKYGDPFPGLTLTRVQEIASNLGIRDVQHLREGKLIEEILRRMESQGLSFGDVMGESSG